MNTKDTHALVKKYLAGKVYFEQDKTYDLLAAYVMSTWTEIKTPANMEIVADAGSGHTTLIKEMFPVTCWSVDASQCTHAALTTTVKDACYSTIYFDAPEWMAFVAELNKFSPFVFVTHKGVQGRWLAQHGLQGSFVVRMMTGSRFMTDEIVPSAEEVKDAVLSWCGVEWVADQRASVDRILGMVAI